LEIPVEVKEKPCTPGVAVVETVVGIDGRVRSATLLSGSGTPMFDRVCVSNAYRWVFDPGRQQGLPVETTAAITCHLDCR